MAAAPVNIPTVVISGGPMLAGTLNKKKISLTTAFEAVGAYSAGKMTEDELEDVALTCCPGCGSCSGMFTANSMNCLTEVLGMGLPGNGTIPAVFGERVALAKKAGPSGHETRRRRHKTTRYYDGKRVQKRTYGRYGTRMFHKQRIAFYLRSHTKLTSRSI